MSNQMRLLLVKVKKHINMASVLIIYIDKNMTETVSISFTFPSDHRKRSC